MITKSETLGQTPTKGKYYKDNKSAVQARDAKRMWVNGKEVKKTHPLYKAGCYKGFENYQTSSPFRDYSLLYAYEVNDRRAGEAAAHARLAKECDNINEWFRLPSAIANELILEVIHEY